MKQMQAVQVRFPEFGHHEKREFFVQQNDMSINIAIKVAK